jgi:peptidoglycan-N-acetylglucosamine deacetylase
MARRAVPALALLVLLAPAAARPTVPLGDDSGRSSLEALARRALPLYCGAGRGRYVAVTFDDGPGPYTRRVLRLLARARARATFFVVGRRGSERPELVRAEARLGEVGNHTWSHPRLDGLARPALVRELLLAQAAVVRATGVRPRLFRPPYEAGTPAASGAARALGLVDVRWSVDSGDSLAGATAASVARAVEAGLRPGAIVLLHETHPWTVAALPRILRAVRRLRLEPVTVPELVALDPPSRPQLVPLRASGRCGG